MARVPDGTFDTYESLTVSSTALGLTAAKIAGKSLALLTFEDAECRVRVDGTDPTSTEGHLIAVGSTLQLNGGTNLSRFRAIRAGSTDVKVRCSYGVG